MRYLKLSPTEYFLRLEEGDDVILSLRDFARKEAILSAIFHGLGSLKRASLAFYNVHEKKFDFRDYAEELEMQNLIGNISIDEEKGVIVHAHINLSRSDLSQIGGHAKPGCIVRTAEIYLKKFKIKLSREKDEKTGLSPIRI